MNIDGFEVYGDVTGSRSTTSLSFNLKGMDPSELSFLLESNGVSNRSGLQCAPMCHESIGTFPNGTVRLSISYFNTEEDIDYALSVLKKISKESNF